MWKGVWGFAPKRHSIFTDDIYRIERDHREFNLTITYMYIFFAFLSKTVLKLGLTCPPGMYSVFLLEASAFKYTPLYDEVKNKFTFTFNKPQS